MKLEPSQDRRKKIVSIALAGCMFLVAAVMTYRYVAGSNVVVADDLVASLDDQSMDVTCGQCGARYSIATKDYMAQIAETNGEASLKCQACGESGVWRSDAPIEFSDDQWRGGYAGQDVLVSELKAYHKLHPETPAVANGATEE